MSIQWDIEELALRVMGKNDEEVEAAVNDGSVEDLLIKKYGVAFEEYCEIVKDLLPFTPLSQGAVTGDKYHAFVFGDGMIVKVEATEVDKA